MAAGFGVIQFFTKPTALILFPIGIATINQRMASLKQNIDSIEPFGNLDSWCNTELIEVISSEEIQK